MNFSIILSTILVGLGIITSLLGSDWFWWIIIIFPIIVGIRVLPRFKIGSDIQGIIFLVGFFIFFGLIMSVSDGTLSIGSIVLFIYFMLIFFILGKMFGKNTGTQVLIIMAGLAISMITTNVVDTTMNEQIKLAETKKAADDKALKEKSEAISRAKLLNSSGGINMSIASGSSMTATGNPFPKVIIK